jgi:hypothetical protein
VNKDTWSILKDGFMFFGGMTGIGYQTYTGEVHELLLIVFTAMVGVPGASALLWLRGNGTTESLPSSSAQQGLSSDSPNSSTPA